MVLHKNKWDHKAKIAYLKKHGLTRGKVQPEITPKWSSKKTTQSARTVYFDDSDSEWDSEDEALLNHFYPEIAEQELSEDQKKKIKRQIVNGLRQKAQEENTEETENNDGEEETKSEDEMGGIYLGTEPENADDEIDLPDLEARISDFVVTDMAKTKNRRMLKNKILDSLLTDYGIESYLDTVKSTDYNKLKQDRKDVDKLTADELHGFRIGQPGKSTSPFIRTLTDSELQEHAERSKKLESAKLYELMKRRFGDAAPKAKVLEINNFNADDKRLMAVLNLKLTHTEEKNTLNDDLDLLLGKQEHHENVTSTPADLDLLLQQAARGEILVEKKTTNTVGHHASKADEDFLDDLLG